MSEEGQIWSTHTERGAVPSAEELCCIPFYLLAPILVAGSQTVADQMKDIVALRDSGCGCSQRSIHMYLPLEALRGYLIHF